MLEPELEGLPEADRIGPARRAEILRLSDGGMGPDKLGAQFRIAYDQINRIVAAERKRRADAWAAQGSEARDQVSGIRDQKPGKP